MTEHDQYMKHVHLRSAFRAAQQKEKGFLSMTEHDQYMKRIYLRNALRAARQPRIIRKNLLDWFKHNEEKLEKLDGFLMREYDRLLRGYVHRRPSKQETDYLKTLSIQAKLTEFFNCAIKILERNTREEPAPTPESMATRLVAQHFSLGPVTASLVELVRHAYICPMVEGLWEELQDAIRGHLATTAILLGCSPNEVANALCELADRGIACQEYDREYLHSKSIAPNEYITREFAAIVWHPPVRDRDELQARLVSQPCEAALSMDDFAHLNGRDDAIRLLRAAVQKRGKGKPVSGVNILLVGRAGTGKTEFAKTLAHAAGASLYSIGEPDRKGEQERGTEFNRRANRRNKLRMAQVLLRSAPDAAILCDEADDVLESTRGTRLANHRLIEETPVPTIYTANSLTAWDESMLRRFPMALRFTAHSPTRQTAILQRMIEKSDLKGIDAPPCARRLVDQLECPPGILAQTIKAIRLINGNADDLYRFSERLERTIATQYARPRLGPPVEARLQWQAFSHLGQDAEDVRRTLTAAVQNRQKGVNILLYGPPGTGKTEFARTLCGEVGTRLYAIGDNEIGAEARLSVNRSKTLDYALEALADEQNAAILFDEMEDFHRVEKLWLNRIVEENPVPIIWACNAIGYYRMAQPFFIDRMLHAIEFRHMSAQARQRVYTDILHKTHMPAPETHQLAEELARSNKVTPRQVTMAANQAAMVNGNTETIRRSVAQKVKLRYGSRPPDTRPIEQYDPSLVHADIDMAALADRMVALGPRRFALCLSGPPGTGKTAFVRHIAEQMGIDLLPKRASDLLNKYVGETEQRIASAFAEAIETRSFLVFDEVDSLLMDRQSAQRSWEVSMVNELLSQMERHPLPFACTTNQRDALDPAAARRFLFRAEFRFLDPPRIRRAFALFFNAKTPAPVPALTKLTPADFANVRERAEVLGFLNDPNRIADALSKECHSKPGGTPTGF